MGGDATLRRPKEGWSRSRSPVVMCVDADLVLTRRDVWVFWEGGLDHEQMEDCVVCSVHVVL